MTLVIVAISMLGFLLLATSHLSKVNKAAVAIFMGTAGWVLYICFGTDFVMSQHADDYTDYLAQITATDDSVKLFIYDNIFLKYVGKAAGVVLFLLSTMTIVEILNNNGCFDFISQWIRSRDSRKLLWTITCATFIISCNLDNLTTTTMMLVIMRSIVQSRRQRMIIGCAIVLAACAGGCMTVIGDPAGLVLWGEGAVTATNFSAWLALPALTAWILPTLLLSRDLPEHLDVEWPTMPYRGEDTNLNIWQRIVMLIVGIGGLWFIPTFHNITKLSPFLGALCVLAVLWIVNEIFNRKLLNADQMILRRFPRVLQYGSIQQMLYVMGILLSMGCIKETGFFGDVAAWLDANIHNIWITGIASGAFSSVIDSFTLAMANLSLYPVADPSALAGADVQSYAAAFVQNGIFWKLTAFSTAIGGCLFGFANMSSLALINTERMHIGWYFTHCTPKILAGWAAGIAILWLETFFMQI